LEEISMKLQKEQRSVVTSSYLAITSHTSTLLRKLLKIEEDLLSTSEENAQHNFAVASGLRSKCMTPREKTLKIMRQTVKKDQCCRDLRAPKQQRQLRVVNNES
jgi:negative regulator of replication initiation